MPLCCRPEPAGQRNRRNMSSPSRLHDAEKAMTGAENLFIPEQQRGHVASKNESKFIISAPPNLHNFICPHSVRPLQLRQ